MDATKKEKALVYVAYSSKKPGTYAVLRKRSLVLYDDISAGIKLEPDDECVPEDDTNTKSFNGDSVTEPEKGDLEEQNLANSHLQTMAQHYPFESYECIVKSTETSKESFSLEKPSVLGTSSTIPKHIDTGNVSFNEEISKSEQTILLAQNTASDNEDEANRSKDNFEQADSTACFMLQKEFENESSSIANGTVNSTNSSLMTFNTDIFDNIVQLESHEILPLSKEICTLLDQSNTITDLKTTANEQGLSNETLNIGRDTIDDNNSMETHLDCSAYTTYTSDTTVETDDGCISTHTTLDSEKTTLNILVIPSNIDLPVEGVEDAICVNVPPVVQSYSEDLDTTDPCTSTTESIGLSKHYVVGTCAVNETISSIGNSANKEFNDDLSRESLLVEEVRNSTPSKTSPPERHTPSPNPLDSESNTQECNIPVIPSNIDLPDEDVEGAIGVNVPPVVKSECDDLETTDTCISTTQSDALSKHSVTGTCSIDETIGSIGNSPNKESNYDLSGQSLLVEEVRNSTPTLTSTTERHTPSSNSFYSETITQEFNIPVIPSNIDLPDEDVEGAIGVNVPPVIKSECDDLDTTDTCISITQSDAISKHSVAGTCAVNETISSIENSANKESNDDLSRQSLLVEEFRNSTPSKTSPPERHTPSSNALDSERTNQERNIPVISSNIDLPVEGVEGAIGVNVPPVVQSYSEDLDTTDPCTSTIESDAISKHSVTGTCAVDETIGSIGNSPNKESNDDLSRESLLVEEVRNSTPTLTSTTERHTPSSQTFDSERTNQEHYISVIPSNIDLPVEGVEGAIGVNVPPVKQSYCDDSDNTVTDTSTTACYARTSCDSEEPRLEVSNTDLSQSQLLSAICSKYSVEDTRTADKTIDSIEKSSTANSEQESTIVAKQQLEIITLEEAKNDKTLLKRVKKKHKLQKSSNSGKKHSKHKLKKHLKMSPKSKRSKSKYSHFEKNNIINSKSDNKTLSGEDGSLPVPECCTIQCNDTAAQKAIHNLATDTTVALNTDNNDSTLANELTVKLCEMNDNCQHIVDATNDYLPEMGLPASQTSAEGSSEENYSDAEHNSSPAKTTLPSSSSKHKGSIIYKTLLRPAAKSRFAETIKQTPYEIEDNGSDIEPLLYEEDNKDFLGFSPNTIHMDDCSKIEEETSALSQSEVPSRPFLTVHDSASLIPSCSVESIMPHNTEHLDATNNIAEKEVPHTSIPSFTEPCSINPSSYSKQDVLPDKTFYVEQVNTTNVTIVNQPPNRCRKHIAESSTQLNSTLLITTRSLRTRKKIRYAIESETVTDEETPKKRTKCTTSRKPTRRPTKNTNNAFETQKVTITTTRKGPPENISAITTDTPLQPFLGFPSLTQELSQPCLQPNNINQIPSTSNYSTTTCPNNETPTNQAISLSVNQSQHDECTVPSNTNTNFHPKSPIWNEHPHNISQSINQPKPMPVSQSSLVPSQHMNDTQLDTVQQSFVPIQNLFKTFGTQVQNAFKTLIDEILLEQSKQKSDQDARITSEKNSQAQNTGLSLESIQPKAVSQVLSEKQGTTSACLQNTVPQSLLSDELQGPRSHIKMSYLNENPSEEIIIPNQPQPQAPQLPSLQGVVAQIPSKIKHKLQASSHLAGTFPATSTQPADIFQSSVVPVAVVEKSNSTPQPVQLPQQPSLTGAEFQTPSEVEHNSKASSHKFLTNTSSQTDKPVVKIRSSPVPVVQTKQSKQAPQQSTLPDVVHKTLSEVEYNPPASSHVAMSSAIPTKTLPVTFVSSQDTLPKINRTNEVLDDILYRFPYHGVARPLPYPQPSTSSIVHQNQSESSIVQTSRPSTVSVIETKTPSNISQSNSTAQPAQAPVQLPVLPDIALQTPSNVENDPQASFQVATPHTSYLNIPSNIAQSNSTTQPVQAPQSLTLPVRNPRATETTERSSSSHVTVPSLNINPPNYIQALLRNLRPPAPLFPAASHNSQGTLPALNQTNYVDYLNLLQNFSHFGLPRFPAHAAISGIAPQNSSNSSSGNQPQHEQAPQLPLQPGFVEAMSHVNRYVPHLNGALRYYPPPAMPIPRLPSTSAGPRRALPTFNPTETHHNLMYNAQIHAQRFLHPGLANCPNNLPTSGVRGQNQFDQSQPVNLTKAKVPSRTRNRRKR